MSVRNSSNEGRVWGTKVARVRYNHRRLHGSLNMATPTEYEEAYYAALIPEPQPA